LIEKYNKIKHDTEAVKDLLDMAMGRPTPENINKFLDGFYSEKGHNLFIALDKVEITGIMGLDDTASPYGWILHLAVRPDVRMRGIGRKLIVDTMKALSLKSVALETDQDAIGFYRACGFEVVEIKSRWPGVRRFRCTRGNMPENVLEYYDNLKSPGDK